MQPAWEDKGRRENTCAAVLIKSPIAMPNTKIPITLFRSRGLAKNKIIIIIALAKPKILVDMVPTKYRSCNASSIGKADFETLEFGA